MKQRQKNRRRAFRQSNPFDIDSRRQIPEPIRIPQAEACIEKKQNRRPYCDCTPVHRSCQTNWLTRSRPVLCIDQAKTYPAGFSGRCSRHPDCAAPLFHRLAACAGNNAAAAGSGKPHHEPADPENTAANDLQRAFTVEFRLQATQNPLQIERRIPLIH